MGEYPDSYLKDPPTLRELCRFIGKNIRVTQEIFQLYHRKSIDQYSREARLHFAGKLLLSSESLNLHEIAHATGYHDASVLSVAFKRFLV